MLNGTVTNYVKNNPGVNRISLVSPLSSISLPSTNRHLSQLLDVVEGLNFLHTTYTIHGDLKGVGASLGPVTRPDQVLDSPIFSLTTTATLV